MERLDDRHWWCITKLQEAFALLDGYDNQPDPNLDSVPEKLGKSATTTIWHTASEQHRRKNATRSPSLPLLSPPLPLLSPPLPASPLLVLLLSSCI